MKKNFLADKSLLITICIIALLLAMSFGIINIISRNVEKESWEQLAQVVSDVNKTVIANIESDREVLQAVADIIAQYDSPTSDEVKSIINGFRPRILSDHLGLLLPDNTLLLPDDVEITVKGNLSFENEAARGNHITNVAADVRDSSDVLRNFVPVQKDGKTIAMLYGLVKLPALAKLLSTPLFADQGRISIINLSNGNYIVDSKYSRPGVYFDQATRYTKRKYNYIQFQLDVKSGAKTNIITREHASTEWMYISGDSCNINQWYTIVEVSERILFAHEQRIRTIIDVFIFIEIAILILYFIWMLWFAGQKNKHERQQNIALEQALRRAESAGNAKTTFLSNMSHDIRTPMNAIIGFTAIATAHIDNKERVEDCLAKITSSSNHLLSLINDILDMSKIESGKIQLQERECDLSDLMHNFMNIVQSQVRAKNIELFIDTMDVEHEHVFVDSLRISQILINIVGNAVKFTEAGGMITVRLSESPAESSERRTYTFTVKDTGVGMSKEFLPHIFEAFSREKNTTISKIEGTGLGLSIAKSIIDMMGGTINVESELGKGTEFIISLPLKIQTEHLQSPVIEDLQGLRALVVDDDFNVCDSVTKMLGQIGMNPDWTLSGKEAVLRAQKAIDFGNRYAAYIIDYAMPDMNGIEVTRRIRKIVGDDIPIFILTAYDYSELEQEAREAGVTAFCQKPLFMSNLRQSLLDATKAEAKPKEEQIEESSFVGKSILLVEDNELNREIATAILADAGFEVVTAADGKIAVDMVSNSKPGQYDVILMDIQMPVMNGYEATRAIRALPNKFQAELPILAMTANAFDDDRREAFNAGMDGHIAKPIDIPSLFKNLTEVFENHRHDAAQ